ncbi:MAG: GTPase Era [Roseiflexaceae bacterium]|nr:GTPase Era [Roseiflexus sp.]MDW8145659.1 GTPase Era [Roseiflexaceae bacterium]
MLTLLYDPDAGSLYWRFIETAEEDATLEGECEATLLLDPQGQVIGVELALDDEVDDDDLTLALAHPQVSFDAAERTLTVNLVGEEPASVQPLEEPAALDFDPDERLLGFKVLPANEFDLGQRLERLAPFLIEREEERAAEAEELPLPPATRPVVPEGPHRSGFVALVGRPNVGKSTLLNALLGQKVAIVSPKPQTTRTAIRGILTRPDAQIVFVDTPGIHEPRNRLGAFMVKQARRAIPDADVVCMVVDITRPPGSLDERIAALVRKASARRILVLNKIDLPTKRGSENLQAYRALAPWDMEVAVSALRCQGLDALVDEIVRLLPEGPPLYPEGQVTDMSERELAAELVREQVLRYTQQEVPHSVAVEVEEWEEKEKVTYIRMTILVERESQKAILIGAGGGMLKKIGSGARQNIEEMLGRPVYLDLWVKAREHWRDDPNALRWLGYTE